MSRCRTAPTSIAIGEHERLTPNRPRFRLAGQGIRACARDAGAVPSVPRAGWRPEAARKRVVAGEEAVSDWDLSPSGDSELLAEHIAVRLRSARRDPESFADFLVRAARSDQLDHLTLSVGDARRDFGERLLHGREANSAVLG